MMMTKLIIPCLYSYHWYLIAVTNPKYCISQGFPKKKCRVFLLDSLGTVPISRLNLVAEFLRATVNVQGLEFNKPHRSRLQVPQQSNYSDCGLYVLFFIQTLLHKQNRLLNTTSVSVSRLKKKPNDMLYSLFCILGYLERNDVE
jgi:Ulp1 family protease